MYCSTCTCEYSCTVSDNNNNNNYFTIITIIIINLYSANTIKIILLSNKMETLK